MAEISKMAAKGDFSRSETLFYQNCWNLTLRNQFENMSFGKIQKKISYGGDMVDVEFLGFWL
jgi:hypothetical protein